MNISKDTAVTISYKVTTPQGKPLDAGNLAYLHGGYENIFPKVEAALEGQAVGFATTIDLAVEDAFGARDESLVRTIPKSEFPPGVKVGGQLQGVGNDGQPQVFNVVKIKGPRGAPGRQPPAGRPGAAFFLQGDGCACRLGRGNRPPPCAWRPRAPPLIAIVLIATGA
jgi:FKBP-type peptidyl-prolyl cis-trans isomerase SlyD